jgi:16S rRNA (cytosine967-C5)-methyltransferase
VRAAAAWVLERTLDSLAPADSFLLTCLPRFDARDQGLLRELVLGSLRWLRLLDHVLASASNRPLSKIEPALLAPLRIGAYQLLFLDRVPAHAAVHEAVEQASHRTHRGGVSFTNAVLRRIARTPRVEAWPVQVKDPVRRLAIETSHPDFLVERWLERFGEIETRRLLAANNQPKALSLLAFKDRGGREILAERLIDAGLDVEPSYLSPLGLTVRSGDPFDTDAFRRGDFYVQDPASQAAVLLPPPEPGERVLDAAAAPGGKAFALMAAEPTLRLTLADVSLPRLDVLRRNLARLGRSVPVLAQDAAEPGLAARFDRVVLDLPCSGTGTLRKHPELKWRLSPEEVGRLSDQALRLLTGAAPLVGPGGRLVAITCSLEAEENEHVVSRFLHRDGPGRQFRREDLSGSLSPGLAEHLRGTGLWRVYPSGNHDGFTVQVLTRKDGT